MGECMRDNILLVVEDINQLTMLEGALTLANIDYIRVIRDTDYGLGYPYLLVDGTPLDKQRAFKWIKEQSKNE